MRGSSLWFPAGHDAGDEGTSMGTCDEDGVGKFVIPPMADRITDMLTNGHIRDT